VFLAWDDSDYTTRTESETPKIVCLVIGNCAGKTSTPGIAWRLRRRGSWELAGLGTLIWKAMVKIWLIPSAIWTPRLSIRSRVKLSILANLDAFTLWTTTLAWFSSLWSSTI